MTADRRKRLFITQYSRELARVATQYLPAFGDFEVMNVLHENSYSRGAVSSAKLCVFPNEFTREISGTSIVIRPTVSARRTTKYRWQPPVLVCYRPDDQIYSPDINLLNDKFIQTISQQYRTRYCAHYTFVNLYFLNLFYIMYTASIYITII